MEGKLTALLVLDLEGFTRFSSSVDTEELSKFVETFKDFVSEKVSFYGGRVIKFLGDGAICSFESIEKALKSAKELVSSYQNQPTKMKAFLDVGDVVFEKEDAFGPSVNFAFRIIETLEGGTLAISEAVYHIIKDKKEFFPSDKLSVKGIGHEIRIFTYGKRKIHETDDVKFFIREAKIIDRLISFYLDVIIFLSSFGLLTALPVGKYLSERHRKIAQSEKKIVEQREEKQEIKQFEIETPIGEIEAGRGKIDIRSKSAQLRAEPGRIEIKLGEGKKISVSYLFLSGFQVIFFSIYLALFWFLFKGKTLGEWIMRLKVIRTDGSPPDFFTSFLRAVLLMLLVIPGGIGIIISLIISKGKSLPHDTLTKTRVIYDY